MLDHGDFACRLGQTVFVKVGTNSTPLELVVTLSGSNFPARPIAQKKPPLMPEESFALIQRELPAGDYTLSVRLVDSADVVLRQATRSFKKPYGGPPLVGIDENNALCVEGKPFFPVMSFGLHSRSIKPWLAANRINTLMSVGFGAPNYRIPAWSSFLNTAGRAGTRVVGPLRGHYWPHNGYKKIMEANELGNFDPNTIPEPNGPGTVWYSGPDKKYYHFRQLDKDKIADYVNAAKEHPGLLMWAWADEPELGGRTSGIIPTEIRRWTDLCHQLDPQHPHLVNFGGYMFTGSEKRTHDHEVAKSYSYLFDDQPFKAMGQAKPFPVKTLVADVLCFDYYPYEYRTRPGWEFITLEDYAQAVDNLRDWNKNLIPTMACVETCDIRSKPSFPWTPAITARQLRNLCWINVVHGIKGIVWFHYFEPTPAENFREMSRFVEDTLALTPLILGPAYQGRVVTTGGGENFRMDAMARKTPQEFGLFVAGVRKGHDFARPEEETLEKVRFTVEGLGNCQLQVYGEGRSILCKDGVFEDLFRSFDARIYRAMLEATHP